jgi:hypothetical protein
MVTHLTTNPPVRCLSMAERTGSRGLNVLWSYVKVLVNVAAYAHSGERSLTAGRARPKLVQPGDREWVTNIQSICAAGYATPPFIIYKGCVYISA